MDISIHGNAAMLPGEWKAGTLLRHFFLLLILILFSPQSQPVSGEVGENGITHRQRSFLVVLKTVTHDTANRRGGEASGFSLGPFVFFFFLSTKGQLYQEREGRPKMRERERESRREEDGESHIPVDRAADLNLLVYQV